MRRHARDLEAHAPSLLGPYAALGRLAVEVARAKGSIDPAQATELAELFDRHGAE